MNILIVEDDFTSMILMKKLLLPYGECTLEADGKKAVSLCNELISTEDYFKLIMLDIMLPSMDGQTILKVIRALEKSKNIPKEKQAKIVMMTSLSEQNDVITARQSGCDAYMVKPINHGKLVEHLQSFGISPKSHNVQQI